jgi:hypothetical protein
MATGASRFVWEAFDPLRYLQFPWRELGLVSLASAALAGAWLAVLRERPLAVQLLAAAALTGLFAGTGAYFHQPLHRCTAPATGPIFCPGSDEEYFSARYVRQHQEGSVRDYLPAAVEEAPEPSDAPARVLRGTARIVEAEAGSRSLHLRIEAATEVTIAAPVFDFPHWRLRIDGEPASHVTTAPDGLIAFDVPAGTHEVDLELEDTGVRRAGNVISLLSWGALLLAGPALFAVRR